jgi:hypothetical protein
VPVGIAGRFVSCKRMKFPFPRVPCEDQSCEKAGENCEVSLEEPGSCSCAFAWTSRCSRSNLLVLQKSSTKARPSQRICALPAQQCNEILQLLVHTRCKTIFRVFCASVPCQNLPPHWPSQEICNMHNNAPLGLNRIFVTLDLMLSQS